MTNSFATMLNSLVSESKDAMKIPQQSNRRCQSGFLTANSAHEVGEEPLNLIKPKAFSTSTNSSSSHSSPSSITTAAKQARQISMPHSPLHSPSPHNLSQLPNLPAMTTEGNMYSNGASLGPMPYLNTYGAFDALGVFPHLRGPPENARKIESHSESDRKTTETIITCQSKTQSHYR